MMKQGTWAETTWPFCTDPEILAQFTCYSVKLGRGNIYLRVYKEDRCRYQFTSSFGANSDNSFSGCLPPEDNKLALEEAQEKIIKEVRRYVR